MSVSAWGPGLLLLSWCGLASASTDAPDVMPDISPSASDAAAMGHMETVQVTARRVEESIMDVAEAVSVVSNLEIDRKGPGLLAEMLRGLPGSYFQQTTPGQGIPIIRGLKGSQVLHLVDGMRLNNAFFRNAPNQYLALVDAYATERVEVVRGSVPSLYGADAMGGVVQVLTAEPVFQDAEWTARGKLYGSYNSVDRGFAARAQAAAGNQGTSLSGGFTYQYHDDREVGGGGKVGPSGYRVQAADFKWRQDLGERSELMLSLQYLKQPSTPRIDELVPGYGQDRPSSLIYEFEPNQRDFLHARYRLESDSGWFERLEVHLGRQVITDDRFTRETGSTDQTRESNESRLDGMTLQFNSPWGSGAAVSTELVWGFEYYDDTISSSRTLTDTATGESRDVSGRFPDGSTMKSAAVYASNSWRWDRFSLDAGLRYSWFDIRLPATGEFDATRLEPSDLTGDLHLGYEISPGVRLFSNIGRGFRPPNIFDLGTLGSRPGNRFNVPNPDLGPESVWSYDLGIKLSRSRWELETYLWYSDYNDRINSRLTGETTPGGRLVVTSDNQAGATLYGVESGFRYFASDSLALYAVANYTFGEESESGGPTVPGDRIPPLNGRFGLVWQHAERFRVEPYVDLADGQDRLSPRDEEDPRIDPSGTDGYATFNVLASWQPSDSLTLGLRLENLSDENYREHGSGIDAPGRNIGLWSSLIF
jgi:outer membrane receptor protein involved in Fe transport